ncbi:AMP-binding protein [Pseudonocardia sp. KRD-184]|uniref:AMP-binding protein n=1 Tax=Pseudonocardia oceani TaxID=2792013 RepID=A0ABS6UHB2_9PSEU|nr:AMP-binding protein [Pseudonocardia oceani]MBW0092654.1 AMP-binding protein [Pseudonocardia oceani]MBW0097174.1 AMP-binding protein [Pseudonocardia oceani]MBW0112106.1 AMP-binding protein [Pseudonocardia oceani]MBW0125525.1 AMP-binding protein [Pseudonocardia oceani]MBW0131647.1 AMP-binding protein [Pseudonocardia oceani]
MTAPSYACGSVDRPLLGETIGQNLRRTAERFGRHTAVVDRTQCVRLTYDELWEQTGRVAGALLARGVRRGDRVGVWAANRYEWVVLQFAAARAGAILVALNPTYEAGELGYALAHSGTSLLLHAAQFRDTDCGATVARLRADCPDLREAIAFEGGWADLLDGSPAAVDAAEQEVDIDDPVAIQYTSGTTGRPKGATLTHHNLLNNGHLVGAGVGFGPTDRVCVPVPLFHCFGMVLGTLGTSTHGAALVLPGGTFDAGRTLEAIQQEGCTAVYGVPTMYLAMLEHPRRGDIRLDSLRTGLIGGAPCAPDLLARIRNELHVPDLSTVCGMTETSPISTQTLPDDPAARRDTTVGRPTPHVEVKIIDPVSGRVVPTGTPGEQCTRGYSVMPGYWDDPTATRDAIDPAGWMRTGDLAVMGDDGSVSIVGRLKDVIIRGGENIHPREVEELLRTHPAVADAHVVGVPHERLGEQVMAWVRLTDGAQAHGEDLAAWCVGRISRSKIPSLWRFTDRFPATASGKVQKFRMREIAVAELGLDAHILQPAAV